MRLFLTSSPCSNQVPENISIPCILNEDNDFVKELSADWKPDSRGLIICASPESFDLNDEMADTFLKAFIFHGLTLSCMDLCDARNEEQIEELLKNRDLIILGGGHVPTQNEFFRRLHLRERIRSFEGIIMGISAGTMNCAETVYAQPELEGESTNPDYQRFIPGLGLTSLMVLPHYQQVKDYILDGKRLFEEITYPDSFGKCFWVLIDGSYILVRDEKSLLCGESYLIHDGKIQKFCKKGEKRVIEG